MVRTFALSLLTVAMLAAGSMVAPSRDASAAAPATLQAAVPSIAVDDAVATAIIGSISAEFATDDVTVQLDRVRSEPVSERDRELQGGGRLRIAGSDWVDFEFSALLDTETAEVTAPRIELASAARSSNASPALRAAFDRSVSAAIAREFAGQPVRWIGEGARVSGAGRIVHVAGQGTADFGVEGTVPTRVTALYDTVARQWLRVSYELGAEAVPAAVASL